MNSNLNPDNNNNREWFQMPQIHDNGNVCTLTGGTDEYNDEESVEKCIVLSTILIPRD